MACVFTSSSPYPWRLRRYGKPEDRKGEANERMAGVQRPPGRGEIRGEFWLGPGDGDLLQYQPLDIVGDYPRDPQLDLRRLLRAVLRLTYNQPDRTATEHCRHPTGGIARRSWSDR